MDGKSKSKYKLTIHIPKTDFLFFWTLKVFNSHSSSSEQLFLSKRSMATRVYCKRSKAAVLGTPISTQHS